MFRANVMVTNVPFLFGRVVRIGDYLDRDERLDERLDELTVPTTRSRARAAEYVAVVNLCQRIGRYWPRPTGLLHMTWRERRVAPRPRRVAP